MQLSILTFTSFHFAKNCEIFGLLLNVGEFSLVFFAEIFTKFVGVAENPTLLPEFSELFATMLQRSLKSGKYSK